VGAIRFIGADLAWREGHAGLVANETGVAVIDGDGQILDAGWTRGVEQTIGRANSCDTLIARLGHLAKADPPLLLQSHPVTSDLAGQPSPVSDPAYKHREDLIDALLRAWTASLWARHGFDCCQVLGLPSNP
jgi:predicted RNase H-like nuclease